MGKMNELVGGFQRQVSEVKKEQNERFKNLIKVCADTIDLKDRLQMLQQLVMKKIDAQDLVSIYAQLQLTVTRDELEKIRSDLN